MEMLHDADIDPAQLEGKRVAILGYGNQGRAQSLNLKDSGIDVVVGLRGGSGSTLEAEAAGLRTALLENAVNSADMVMMLAPDENHAALYREIEPHLRRGAALGFSHGPFGSLRLRRAARRSRRVHGRAQGTRDRAPFPLPRWQGNDLPVGRRERLERRVPEIALAYGRSIGCGELV